MRKFILKKLILALLLVLAGCAGVTPATRLGIQVVTCRHDEYVKADSVLNEEQKADRLKMSEEVRKAVGISDPCPDVGR